MEVDNGSAIAARHLVAGRYHACALIRLLTKPERKLSWLLPPLSNN